MTLNAEIPYALYQGDGSKDLFTFDFSLTEDLDLYVYVNQVLVQRYSDYDIQNLTDTGGEVLFTTAPPADSSVELLRSTDKTQQQDYEQFSSFPAETFESGQDKIMRVIQELINGTFTGVDEDGNPITLSFDLGVELSEFLTTITNSGGTDAPIPAWVSGETAGVFIGEYDLAANLPADESATTKPDGYVWLGHG